MRGDRGREQTMGRMVIGGTVNDRVCGGTVDSLGYVNADCLV